ncbi:Mss4-like protein [Apodospora peruviana]|uniref:Mss4-like protein n=1 Tax=Apodospora peruviana TaxID=516989 RepID=A0AAE0M052_9PEZI|nr:Mss4-like protein [Apodospora peruviana]
MKVQCQCGAVSFETPTPAPTAVYHCHCTECQRQSSSAFGTSAIFPANGLFPLSADLQAKLGCWTRPAKEGRTMDCYFCNACGVRIMHRIRNADGQERPTVSIKGGAVKDLDWSEATHIYTRSAVVPIPPGAEKYETTPPPNSPALVSGRRNRGGQLQQQTPMILQYIYDRHNGHWS